MSASRTRLFVILAVLITTPCWSKVTVVEHVLPATDNLPFTPALCGNWVIAVQNSDPNNGYSSVGAVIYDLKESKVYSLCKGRVNAVALAGTTAVWSGNPTNVESLKGKTRGGNGILIACDLNTGEYSVPKLKTATCNDPTACGDYVTYEYKGLIYLYNLRTDEEKQISDDQPIHMYPDIGGDLVVWCESDSSKKQSRIQGYRISTGQEYYFSEAPVPGNSRPATDGDYVVWMTGNYGGMFHDVKARKTRMVKDALYPDVSNGLVIYEKSAAPVKDQSHSKVRIVCGMDLRAPEWEEFRISKNEGIRQSCIGDNRAVWVEGKVLHYADLIRDSERTPVAAPTGIHSSK